MPAKVIHTLIPYTGAAKLGTDESAFNSVLATRSWAHLRQVMTEYQTMHGHTLERAVVSEFSANAEKGLLGIRKSQNFDFKISREIVQLF
jgi:annexin A7/11